MSDKNILKTASEKILKFIKDKINVDEMGSATIEGVGDVIWEGDLAEGSAVTIEADGEAIPAPEGTHVLAAGDMEGATIVLSADGVVESITMPGEETEEEALTGEELMATFAMQTTQIQKLTDRADALEAENKKLTAKVDKLSKEPSAPAIKNKHKKPGEHKEGGDHENLFGLTDMNPLFYSRTIRKN